MAKFTLVTKKSKKTATSLMEPARPGGLLISIIIPTYNEEGNIADLVRAIQENMRGANIKEYEIIIVDDASKDKTPAIMGELVRKNNNIIGLHREGKKGLFSAVCDGIFIASGEYVLTMDADFSHPPGLIPIMIEEREKYDIVSGSRFVKGGGMKVPARRRWGARGINAICGFIMGVSVKDLGGDFHLFKRSVFLDLPLRYPAQFGEFSFEIFLRAQKKGLSVIEIPFVYKERIEGDSKMRNVMKFAFIYIQRAFLLRFENWVRK